MLILGLKELNKKVCLLGKLMIVTPNRESVVVLVFDRSEDNAHLVSTTSNFALHGKACSGVTDPTMSVMRSKKR